MDLEAQTIAAPSGKTISFSISSDRKEKLLKGLDAIGETLQFEPDIGRFEDKRRLARPWA